MPHQERLNNINDVLKLLKQLSENDRLLLGLYLYERLSIEQVKMILEKIPAEVSNPELSR